MLIGFKTQLKLNHTQRVALAKHAGIARHSYNWGLGLCKQILEYNKNNPNDKIKFPTAIDLHKWLVALVKPENPWYYEVSKCAPQYALRNLRNAFDRFLKIPSVGFPKFKKKGRNDSFTLDGTVKVVDHLKIQIPVIGILKTYERLPKGYKPKSVTISRQADHWFISYKIEVEEAALSTNVNSVGIDLGVLRFATLSNGEQVDSPRPYKALEKKLAKLQWRNRNKELHSNNWKKVQVKIARLHAQIGNIRKDFIHKLTTQLAKSHGKIVIEDCRPCSNSIRAGKRQRIPRLNVKGMIAFGHLAKAVNDSGFYEFRRQLEYKCQLYGSKLILASRWFASTKTCFNCGLEKDKIPLRERVMKCSCGWHVDRDYNASLNLVRIVCPEFMPVGRQLLQRGKPPQRTASQEDSEVLG